MHDKCTRLQRIRRSIAAVLMLVALVLALLPAAAFASSGDGVVLGTPEYTTGRYRQYDRQYDRQYSYRDNHKSKYGYSYWSGDDDDDDDDDKWEGHHSTWDNGKYEYRYDRYHKYDRKYDKKYDSDSGKHHDGKYHSWNRHGGWGW